MTAPEFLPVVWDCGMGTHACDRASAVAWACHITE